MTVAGEVRTYRHVSDESGRWLDQHFCGRCGSNIGITLEAVPGIRTIAAGTFDGGMIPKVEGCLQTLHRGVGKIHIVDGRLRHSLLLEIFTTRGVGTQILKD